MLVPRAPDYVEVWWGESESGLELVGVATGADTVLALARRICPGDAADAPTSLDTARAARTARLAWMRRRRTA